jgi:hypothetical protein
MFIKPKEGLLVIDPSTYTYLPAEGKEVPASIYWHRRLRDGDIETVEIVQPTISDTIVKE